jgi:hypothetical protein
MIHTHIYFLLATKTFICPCVTYVGLLCGLKFSIYLFIYLLFIYLLYLFIFILFYFSYREKIVQILQKRIITLYVQYYIVFFVHVSLELFQDMMLEENIT